MYTICNFVRMCNHLVGTMGCRNNRLSEQWAVGTMARLNNGLSEQWVVGTMGRRNNDT